MNYFGRARAITKNWLRALVAGIRKEPLTVLVLIVIAMSFAVHAVYRNSHFQEDDSALSYKIIYEFPKSGLSKYSGLYGEGGHIISSEMANTILSVGFVKKLVATYAPHISQDAIIHHLTAIQPLSAFRLALVTALAAIPLPHALTGFFALPLGSSYSAGPGFLYGLFSSASTSYADFMSRMTLLTLFMFHLGVLLLFLTARRLGINRFAAALAAFLMLFSISLYSYGYHLGSTVWNVVTPIAWIWIWVRYYHHPKILRIASWAMAVLIFFDYLLIFYWLAFLLVQYGINTRGKKSFRDWAREGWLLIKSQCAAIVGILLCVVLFYQPGQGAFFNTTPATFFSDFYYVILNFYSFYNHSQILDIIQFILGFALTCTMIVVLARANTKDGSARFTVAKTLLVFLILYLIAVCFGALGFAASRHILFLAPLLFLGVAFVFDTLSGTMLASVMPFAVAIIALLGFLSLPQRISDTKDPMATVTVPSGVYKVISSDIAIPLLYHYGTVNTPLELKDPTAFVSGETYFYISRARSLTDILANAYTASLSDYLKEYHYGTLRLLYQTVSEQDTTSNVYFMAYNPTSGIANNIPNALHITEFKVLGVVPR